ncbi:MAG: methylated-DNA--[protein]-cysteine S-methyltransferase [Rubrivivax sp.]|nr:methylated-DNA--[protein]-cysteine S-methyltransferase [Rubrivivax sp.]
MKTPAFEARTRVDSPLGPLTLAATARGLALAWFDHQQHRSDEVDAPEDPGHPHLLQAALELQAYWQDARTSFSVALDPQGTPFQQAVWRVLCTIGSGHTSTYGEVAQRIGKAAAVRAVGAAIGRNPIGIIVPCHRVIGRDGSLTGYAGGLPRKEELLRREGVLLA